MNLTASQAHDVLGAHSSNQQGIGDERTMTAPPHCFRAHQGNSVVVRKADQFFEALCKLRSLHVVGINSQGGISCNQLVKIVHALGRSGFFNPSRDRRRV